MEMRKGSKRPEKIKIGCRYTSVLALTDPITRHLSLPATAKTADVLAAQCQVFCFTSLHPGAPFLPVTQLEFVFHESDNFGFRQPELYFNSLERRTVFPGHFDDAVDGLIGEVVF